MDKSDSDGVDFWTQSDDLNISPGHDSRADKNPRQPDEQVKDASHTSEQDGEKKRKSPVITAPPPVVSPSQPQPEKAKDEDDDELEMVLEGDYNLDEQKEAGKSGKSDSDNSEKIQASAETKPSEEKAEGGVRETLPVASGRGQQKSSGEIKIYHKNLDDTKEESEVRIKGRMGDKMVEIGLITEAQLNVALQEKKLKNRLLGEILVELGFIDENSLTTFLSESSGYELFDPKNIIVDRDALTLIDKDIALKQGILPLSIDGDEIHVAMADPYDVVAMDTLRKHIPKGLSIKPKVATVSTLHEAIDAAYGYSSSINDIMKELEKEAGKFDLAALKEDESYSHPIVRLVNSLLQDAVKMKVSDLHFEPEENFVRLRYRLDGVLYTAQILHKQYWNAISQRLKIMSNMNIADKLKAQDGRFGLNVGGREADFRVSSLPTVHGENIVLRVLDKRASIMPLEGLGFSPENLNIIKKAQKRPEGIIIVTGPTGSGKTTSLYSMLNEINDVEVNIQTLEDPVEYSLPMIRQTHVKEGVLEFGDGIKALLRQDPDIIFIGEIRDHVTAEMALKAAMTGHQVYTTLHTNDSFGAIPRLLDLGLKPGMVAGAIIAVFAQRLTRRLCGECKIEYTPDHDECRILGVDPEGAPKIFKARQGGCGACGGQGYKGRVAIAEILTFDEEMDDLLAKGMSKADLKELAVKKGFKSMRDDGIIKVLEGVTDFQALSKVVNLNS